MQSAIATQVSMSFFVDDQNIWRVCNENFFSAGRNTADQTCSGVEGWCDAKSEYFGRRCINACTLLEDPTISPQSTMLALPPSFFPCQRNTSRMIRVHTSCLWGEGWEGRASNLYHFSPSPHTCRCSHCTDPLARRAVTLLARRHPSTRTPFPACSRLSSCSPLGRQPPRARSGVPPTQPAQRGPPVGAGGPAIVGARPPPGAGGGGGIPGKGQRPVSSGGGGFLNSPPGRMAGGGPGFSVLAAAQQQHQQQQQQQHQAMMQHQHRQQMEMAAAEARRREEMELVAQTAAAQRVAAEAAEAARRAEERAQELMRRQAEVRAAELADLQARQAAQQEQLLQTQRQQQHQLLQQQQMELSARMQEAAASLQHQHRGPPPPLPHAGLMGPPPPFRGPPSSGGIFSHPAGRGGPPGAMPGFSPVLKRFPDQGGGSGGGSNPNFKRPRPGGR